MSPNAKMIIEIGMAADNGGVPKITIKPTLNKPSMGTSFKVKGATLDDLRKALSKHKHWGEYEVKANFGYKYKGKLITEISVKTTPNILMPVWSDYSKASKDDKAAWDKMYAILLKHENNHHALALEVFAKFFAEIEAKNKEIEKLNKDLAKEKDKAKREKRIKSFDPVTVDSIKKRLGQLQTDLQAAQDSYDAKTDHGKKEGATL